MTHDFEPAFNPGDMVSFLGCNPEQVAWGNNDDPEGVLLQGFVYIVEELDIHAQYTKVKLVDVPGWYNSVCFEKYPM